MYTGEKKWWHILPVFENYYLIKQVSAYIFDEWSSELCLTSVCFYFCFININENINQKMLFFFIIFHSSGCSLVSAKQFAPGCLMWLQSDGTRVILKALSLYMSGAAVDADWQLQPQWAQPKHILVASIWPGLSHSMASGFQEWVCHEDQVGSGWPFLT